MLCAWCLVLHQQRIWMPTDKHHQMFMIREKEENAGQRRLLFFGKLAVNSTSIRFPWHLLIFRLWKYLLCGQVSQLDANNTFPSIALSPLEGPPWLLIHLSLARTLAEIPLFEVYKGRKETQRGRAACRTKKRTGAFLESPLCGSEAAEICYLFTASR